jgi:hypothetical protein
MWTKYGPKCINVLQSQQNEKGVSNYIFKAQGTGVKLEAAYVNVSVQWDPWIVMRKLYKVILPRTMSDPL